jgi:hypothetical protein
MDGGLEAKINEGGELLSCYPPGRFPSALPRVSMAIDMASPTAVYMMLWMVDG